MEKLKKLKEYITNWQKTEGEKPKNDQLFVNEFVTFLNDFAFEDDLSFNGDGSYFGKQVTIEYGSMMPFRDDILYFEISYSKDKISVYTARHSGFWTPTYLTLDKGDENFEGVKTALFSYLNRCFGLN